MAPAKGEGVSACQCGQTALAARLLDRLSFATSGGNLIFSPLSIHVALALMSASAGGDTLDEILAVAGVPSRGELEAFVMDKVVGRTLADRSAIGGPCIAFACGAWSDKRFPLKPAYRDTIVRTYKGDTWTVDFREHPVEARSQINAWVAKVTKSLLDPKDQSADSVKVVANAIYFKGEWADPFAKEDTVDGDFRRLDGSSVEVPFMKREMWRYEQIACHAGFKVLKLPYKTADEGSPGFTWKLYRSLPKFAMCVFLPDARDGLRALVDRMTSGPEFLHEHLPTATVPVGEFRVPKFKLSFMRSIVGVLQSLGLRLPFDPMTMDMIGQVENADGLDVQLCVSEVVHKAVIEVNEEGCQAAAYTEEDDDMGFSLDADEVLPPKPVDFVADHPFAFFIVEVTTGTVVFSGHVLDPSKEE